METLSENAKKVISALSAHYDALMKNPVQVPYVEMDPVSGGMFQEEASGMAMISPEDLEEVLEELLEEKLVCVSEREKVVMSPTVWPTNKGLVEGRSASIELRKEEKEKAQEKEKEKVTPVTTSRVGSQRVGSQTTTPGQTP